MMAMTSKEYIVTAKSGTCFLCLISHFLPMLPIGHFQQSQSMKENGEHGTLVSLQDRVQHDESGFPGGK